MSDLQSRTKGGELFRTHWTETWKSHEPKLRLWCGTDSNNVAEGRIHLDDDIGQVKSSELKHAFGRLLLHSFTHFVWPTH